MSLAPDDQQVLDMMKVAGRPPVPALPEEARRMYRASRAALQPESPISPNSVIFQRQDPLVLFRYDSTAELEQNGARYWRWSRHWRSR
jgi:hypothetical protein